jgi:hypothetical protein
VTPGLRVILVAKPLLYFRESRLSSNYLRTNPWNREEEPVLRSEVPLSIPVATQIGLRAKPALGSIRVSSVAATKLVAAECIPPGSPSPLSPLCLRGGHACYRLVASPMLYHDRTTASASGTPQDEWPNATQLIHA